MNKSNASWWDEIATRELKGRKDQFKRQKANLRKTSISLNEVDIVEWNTALANASGYERALIGKFCYHEDDKDILRVN